MMFNFKDALFLMFWYCWLGMRRQ